MAEYRLYHLEDARIIGAESFDAVNDEAALLYAGSKRTADDTEVWQGGRKLGSAGGGSAEKAVS